jgi:hypothetical protein
MKPNKTMILAIDPGTNESAFIRWDGTRVYEKGICSNETMLDIIGLCDPLQYHLLVEEIRSYGMAVGIETFTTVWWSGRFVQRWSERCGTFEMIPRGEIKLHHCQSPRAKDGNVIRALKDRFGEKGTKKSPGLLYGIKSHEWQALALAVYWSDTHKPGA